MKRLLWVLIISLVLALPGSAMADVRSGSVADPDDVPSALNPPDFPDLANVSASYDTAGSITFTATFYSDTRQRPSEWYSTEISAIFGTYNPDGYNVIPNTKGSCDTIGDQSSEHQISLNLPFTGTATATVAHYTGSLSAPVTVSPDGRSLSVTFSQSQIAGQGYQCMTGSLSTWTRSTASNLNSYYGVGCDCWYVYRSDLADSYSTVWFPGYPLPADPKTSPTTTSPTTAPPVATKPACNDGIDNDGDGYTDHGDADGFPLDPDPGCYGPEDPSEEPDCADAVDNDADGLIDKADPGCGYGKKENSPKPRLPQLTQRRAQAYLRTALTRKFKGSFAGGYAFKPHCARGSKYRFSCKPSWVIGDLVFYGKATIWLQWDKKWQAGWHYRYTMTRFDEYCGLVEHRKGCKKTYRVK